jgi:hypothetical protein
LIVDARPSKLDIEKRIDLHNVHDRGKSKKELRTQPSTGMIPVIRDTREPERYLVSPFYTLEPNVEN